MSLEQTDMDHIDSLLRKSLPQEKWDYLKFLTEYNTLADARGGWHYEADGRTPEVHESRYLGSPETYPTIAAFAEGLFIWEQRLNI